jgi:hypothetical protein
MESKTQGIYIATDEVMYRYTKIHKKLTESYSDSAEIRALAAELTKASTQSTDYEILSNKVEDLGRVLDSRLRSL